MTTIAWDGKTLAADRMASDNGTSFRTRKVFRITRPDGKPTLIGCSGESGSCNQYVRWARGEIERPEAFGEFRVISIDERGCAWIADKDIFWIRVPRPFYAVGSGADYALGAMAAGKTAREAIVIASKLDINTGMGVDAVRLRP